jgi:hypothetical protein
LGCFFESRDFFGILKITGDGVIAVNGSKMGNAENRVQTDDRHLALTVCIHIWLHHPHADVRTWLVPDSGEPRNEHANILQEKPGCMSILATSDEVNFQAEVPSKYDSFGMCVF